MVWTTLIVIEEIHCHHYMSYSFRLTAKVLLYASSLKQDSTYHGLWYTSRGYLAAKIAKFGPIIELLYEPLSELC